MCVAVCGGVGRQQRIVGGRRADPHEFPWLVLLSHAGTPYCGGALITSHHVLTAAHCLYGRKMSDIMVTLGEHDRKRDDDGWVITRGVAHMAIHNNFSLAKIQNDIGIITMDQPVNISTAEIATACLPTKAIRDYTGVTGVVAGWGRVGEKSVTAVTLRKVSLPIISQEQCRNMGYPKKRITDTVFCAGHPKGKKDACQGDSGGPIQINGTTPGYMEVIGVVSWGRGCGRPSYPGVYTRVDHYMDWIAEKTAGACLCHRPRMPARFR
ncbi:hypothetical protein AAG570_002704 [Ranatra chinensis]|uniref:Peptidase S1 domain-containing protein n=1 Tax=Ranatra chinensis TaxID=642074 RepID=A0ABD0YR32_9HEMI